MNTVSRSFSLAVVSLCLSGCGGGSDAFGNPPTIVNPEIPGGKTLSFAYFQRCINPIFLALLPIQLGGTTTNNTCAGSGCHDNTSGTGGAFRVVANAQPVELTSPDANPAAIRSTDMFKNFYSAQGSVVIGSASQSRLLTKPLLSGVLHGGGLIFLSEDDTNARLIRYWISRPVPQGQDEFSTTSAAMFTPPNPETGACNTQ